MIAGARISRSLLSLSLVLFCSQPVDRALAKPRPPMPPFPERTLGFWDFDEAYYHIGAQDPFVLWNGLDLVESWSGYALRREGVAVTPVLLPVLREEGRANLTLEEGTLRFWFRPSFGTGGLGAPPPGDYGRLLELVAVGGQSVDVWWSLYVDPTGSTLYLSGQGEGGAADFLKAEIRWQAGEWHMLALTYGPTLTTLVVDGLLVATGGPLPVPHAAGLPRFGVVLGSCADGRHPAQGQFEEVTSFDGKWGPGDLAHHYSVVGRYAAKGPITVEEERARAEAVSALKAWLAAKQALEAEAALGGEGGGYSLLMGGTNGLWLGPPVVQGTNISLVLWNAETNKSYDIYFRSGLETLTNVWSFIAAQGLQGQTNFTNFATTTLLGDYGFFRAIEGQDWDGDGSPNYMDAQPSHPGVSNLTVTIESPAHGTTVD